MSVTEQAAKRYERIEWVKDLFKNKKAIDQHTAELLLGSTVKELNDYYKSRKSSKRVTAAEILGRK